jgi:3-oxoacyl-[acyl-carrier protein] reductase
MGLLEGRNAIVYGGGGSIGGAVARAFAREGATVHLAGRTQASLDAVADEIGADTAVLDALDEAAVEAHADAVGRIDVSMNLIAHPYTHGTPFAELDVEDFLAPAEVALRSSFLTARAAARRMIPRGSGAILFFGGTGAPMTDYHLGGTQVAFDAVESLRRLISAELGRYGIRAVSLITGGIFDGLPEGMPGRDEIVESALAQAMLPRTATYEDVGNAAVFAASDMGAALTAATINISCGAIVDY